MKHVAKPHSCAERPAAGVLEVTNISAICSAWVRKFTGLIRKPAGP